MKMYNYFLMIFIFAACSPTPQNRLEYLSYYNQTENGFTKSRQVNVLDFKVYYRPTNVMLANELDWKKKYTSRSLDSLKSLYNQTHYFLFEVKAVDGSNMETALLKQSQNNLSVYQNMIEELMGDLGTSFHLYTSSDTLSPSLFHYERAYEVGGKLRFVLGFKKTETTHLTLSYHDRFFNASYLNYKFDLSSLKEIELPKKLLK